MPKNKDIKEIGLRELIAAVKQELTFAAADVRDAQSGMFLLEECELEVAVTAERDGKGEISVKVLDFGGSLGGGLKRSEANTVRVKFKPQAKYAEMLYPMVDEGLKHGSEPPAEPYGPQLGRDVPPLDAGGA